MKICFWFFFFFSIPFRIRRKTAEKTAFKQRHGGHGPFVRSVARRRDNHIVVHVQSAAATTVVVRGGRDGVRAGSGARRTVQLGRATARQLQAGDKRTVGQVQRARHGDDHHENREVSNCSKLYYYLSLVGIT